MSVLGFSSALEYAYECEQKCEYEFVRVSMCKNTSEKMNLSLLTTIRIGTFETDFYRKIQNEYLSIVLTFSGNLRYSFFDTLYTDDKLH